MKQFVAIKKTFGELPVGKRFWWQAENAELGTAGAKKKVPHGFIREDCITGKRIIACDDNVAVYVRGLSNETDDAGN